MYRYISVSVSKYAMIRSSKGKDHHHNEIIKGTKMSEK